MELKNEADVAVAECGETTVVKPRDILPVVKNGSRVGTVERSRYLEQGGLSGAARPHNGDNLIITYRKRYVVKDPDIAVRLVDTFKFNHPLKFIMHDFIFQRRQYASLRNWRGIFRTWPGLRPWCRTNFFCFARRAG